MNNTTALTEYFDDADEITKPSDDIGEMNAARNSYLLGSIFQEFNSAFTQTTQANG